MVHVGNARSANDRGAPEHDPEKWIPLFGKRSCSTNDVERDSDSKKSHHARRRLLAILKVLTAMVVAYVGCAVPTANGETYPARPIKIIVPTAPGGLTDLLARTLAQKLTENGATTIVENRSGGGGAIGAQAAAKSSPDGYSVYMGLHQTQVILQHLTKLPYDPDKDFIPVVYVGTAPTLLSVNPSVPARTVQELIAYAKANPGRLSFASQGNGSLGHIGGELFKQTAGINIVHVPFRGAGPAMQDLIAGHVTMMLDTVPSAMPQLADGRIRPLAVTSRERVAAIPDVPTMTEAGLPDVHGGTWFGLFVPAGVAPDVVKWLNVETNKIFSKPDLHRFFAAQGVQLPLGSPEAFAAHVIAERQRWGEIIARAAIRVD
jgi:tripartite-type tricarboxylate transporter receptor subunit TctC